MAATLNVLANGYADDHAASTVVPIREADVIVDIDPGMVASRNLPLGHLHAVGVHENNVTDVFLGHHHSDQSLNAALFPKGCLHDVCATDENDVWGDGTVAIQRAPSVMLLG